MAGIPKKYGKACVNLILVVVVALGCIFLVPKIMLVFMPFIIGWFLAWLATPFVNFCEEKLKIKRKISSIFVLISVIAGVVFLICYITNRFLVEVSDLLRILPGMWDNMKMEFVGFAGRWSGLIEKLPEEMVDGMNKLGQSLGEETGVLIGKLSMPSMDAVFHIPEIIIGVVMCLLSAYFFVAEKDYVTTFLKKKIPRDWQKKSRLLKQITGDVIVGYLKAQLKIEFWVYLVMAAGFLLLKVPYGYLIALPIAFLDFLPVFGTGTVLIPWTILKLLWGEYMYALALFGIWGISQLVRQVIQPKVIGDSMGMATVPSLILLYVGYRLAGVAGMIVAVPLGILMMAMNRAGFFDNSKKSFLILWHGLHTFRQFTDEDLK